jgi:aspartate ammonia-lyase
MSEDATAAPKLNEVLYGKQTQLSLQSFTRKARRLRDIPAFVRNYALVKRAAAQANLTLGRLDEQRALAIIDACDEIADGSHLEQFPTALLLGGGGTTSNMNLNEVIANRATQIGQIAVHPNDHANASQSTNDTFPTAMALTLMDLAQAPLAALHELTESLCTKAQEYADTPYLAGPVCKMQLRLRGSNSGGQARAVRRATEQLRDAVMTWPRCHSGQPWWVPG